MSQNNFSGKFGSTQQGPETQVQTSPSASVTPAAAATLELLKNPLEGVARGENQGMVYGGEELPGYYSVHCSRVKRAKGKPLMGSRLGGRFYFPLDGLTDEDTRKLKGLVDKELAVYVFNDPA